MTILRNRQQYNRIVDPAWTLAEKLENRAEREKATAAKLSEERMAHDDWWFRRTGYGIGRARYLEVCRDGSL